ncbi:MAG: hypothetical protein KBC00_00535 [Candidatus Levybacteria bacterium]|nr:hypothetical protein [Candidatus Levybacteria bacterium]MBP9815140.1 hypothetical protein [Candidatus Levybacteria bacterium]
MNERYSSHRKEPSTEELKLRLIKASEPVRKHRREFNTTHPTSSYSPISLNNASTEEMFVILIEEIRRYKTAISGNAAVKIRSGIYQIADDLTDTLPGNDSGVKFVTESMEYIENNNSILGDEVSSLIKAADERRFERETKREDFYRKWRKNQLDKKGDI